MQTLLFETKTASYRQATQLIKTCQEQKGGFDPSAVGGGPHPRSESDFSRAMAEIAIEANQFAQAEVSSIVDHWAGFQERLKHGLESGQARDVLKKFLDLLDAWFEIANAPRLTWHFVLAVGGPADELHVLEEAEAKMQAIKESVVEMHAFLSRKRQPVDPVLLDKALLGISEGRFQTPEQMRSRFRKTQG